MIKILLCYYDLGVIIMPWHPFLRIAITCHWSHVCTSRHWAGPVRASLPGIWNWIKEEKGQLVVVTSLPHVAKF